VQVFLLTCLRSYYITYLLTYLLIKLQEAIISSQLVTKHKLRQEIYKQSQYLIAILL